MTKMRVYELARELEVESKVILAKAKSAGIAAAKSHQSTLSGDDVANLRSAFNGGEVAKPATAVRKKTVIRRRKKESEIDEVQADSEDAPAAAPIAAAKEEPVGSTNALKAAEALFSGSTNESETPVKPVVAPIAKEEVVEPIVAKAPIAPAPVAPAPVAPAPVVKAPIAPAPVPEAPVAETPVVDAPAAAAPAPAPAPVAKRKRESGATIVRKATPEEIEEQESRNAQRTGRREDARGTRVTGMGLLKNRPQRDEEGETTSAPAPRETADRAAPDSGGQYSGRNKSAVGSTAKKKEESQEAGRSSKKQKRVGASLTARALLEKASSLDRELNSDIPTSPYPGARGKSKTVYTPSHGGRRRDHKRRKDLKKTEVTMPRASYRVVKITGETISVGDLANQLHIKAAEIIKKLMADGIMATINEPVDIDTATLIATEYNFEVKLEVITVADILKKAEAPAKEMLTRAPIVTIMGHVDHGKTSILDAIKSSDVAAGEAGGITQHIGAYSIIKDGKPVTFLDTPGHEAFSTMRSRGAQVTDLVILVVAADDGVMPQTIEAISHAKDAGVPIIVAVNKMDKPGINVDRVYTELTEHGVQSEEWGGDTQFIKCSALERTGLDELLSAILLQAEVLELKASPKGAAEGHVIEAHLDKGRGPVATLVLTSGTLNVGDQIVAGFEIGRVRGMRNHLGEELKSAGPADAVEVTGLSGVPMAGDIINSCQSEKIARDAADWRRDQERMNASTKSSAQSLEDLLSRVSDADVCEVPFIVKGDTQGSVEAVTESIMKLNTDRVKNRIIHGAVGGVTASDITLAAASKSVIIAFNTRASAGLDMIAENQGVIINYFNIIYDIVDTVKAIMVGTLPPDVSEVRLGSAEVRKPISVPKIGTVAGSAVIDGKITRNSNCRLIRDDIVIYEGKLSSLRRFKDDVKEVATGYECGISIEGYNDIKEGDVIESFVFEETAATL
jgi:translation initiation factor IF-2